MGAGEKRELLAFDKRGVGSSEGGNKPGEWSEQFRTSARILFLKGANQGNENIMAQRLTGINTIIITVHGFSKTELVTTGWRARDVRTGETFNIRTVNPGERGFDIDMLCESGGTDD